jgi:hypothetical protein
MEELDDAVRSPAVAKIFLIFDRRALNHAAVFPRLGLRECLEATPPRRRL